MAKPTTARARTFTGARPSPLTPYLPFLQKHSGAQQRKLLTLLMCLIVAACGGNGSTSVADVGGFRVVHAVSDSPEISFFIEGSSLGTLGYGQVSGFLTLADGNFDVDAVFNTIDGETTFLLDDERVGVQTLEQTTLVLAGTVAAPVAFEIEQENPDIATDAAEFQLIHTAGVGALDLYVTTPGAPLGMPQATVAANSASGLVATDAGSRQVRLTAEGSSTVLFDSGPFTLPGGQRLLLHARPYFGPGAATVDLALIDGGITSSFPEADLPAAVRIANAIGDLPAADVLIESGGETTTLPSLPANSFSAEFAVVPGTVDISVTMETDPGTLFVADSSVVFGGEQRTFIAAGNFGSNTTTGRLAVDPQRPLSTAAQINFLHGSASVGEVDIYVLSGDEAVTGSAATIPALPLLANSNLTVLGGTYRVAITRPNETTELTESVSITVANNVLYSILLTDADGGGEPLQIIQGPNFE